MCNVKTLDKPGNGFILLVLSIYKNKCTQTHFLKTLSPKKVFSILCVTQLHMQTQQNGQADGRNYMCRKKMVSLLILG